MRTARTCYVRFLTLIDKPLGKTGYGIPRAITVCHPNQARRILAEHDTADGGRTLMPTASYMDAFVCMMIRASTLQLRWLHAEASVDTAWARIRPT